MKYYLIAVLSLALTSCKQNKAYKIEDIYENKASMKDKQIGYYNTGEIKYIDDNPCEKKVIGSSFEFSLRGYLRRYGFMTKCYQAQYVIDFDSLGQYQKTDGGPIVYRHSDYYNDTMEVKYFYSLFLYRDVKIQLTPDGKHYTDAPREKDNRFKDVVQTTYYERMTKSNRFYLVTKFSGRFIPTDSLHEFYDTIDFTRKNKINEVQ